jgi:hypothetical protein
MLFAEIANAHDDVIEECRRLCDSHGLWLHVSGDCVHIHLAAATQCHASTSAIIESADSIAFRPAQWFNHRKRGSSSVILLSRHSIANHHPPPLSIIHPLLRQLSSHGDLDELVRLAADADLLKWNCLNELADGAFEFVQRGSTFADHYVQIIPSADASIESSTFNEILLDRVNRCVNLTPYYRIEIVEPSHERVLIVEPGQIRRDISTEQVTDNTSIRNGSLIVKHRFARQLHG